MLIVESGMIEYELLDPIELLPGPVAVVELSGEASIVLSDQHLVLMPEVPAVLPAGAIRLSNNGSERVTAIWITAIRQHIVPTGGLTDSQLIDTTGVRLTLLAANGVNSGRQSDQVHFSLGMAFIPVEASLPMHSVSAAEVFVVSAGQISTEFRDGMIVSRARSGEFVQVRTGQTFGAGDVGRLHADTGIEYRASNAGPASIWIVTLQPSET